MWEQRVSHICCSRQGLSAKEGSLIPAITRVSLIVFFLAPSTAFAAAPAYPPDGSDIPTITSSEDASGAAIKISPHRYRPMPGTRNRPGI